MMTSVLQALGFSVARTGQIGRNDTARQRALAALEAMDHRDR
jgi:hypothetical protein